MTVKFPCISSRIELLRIWEIIFINFQDLFFDEEIIQIEELSPGYDDHASDVWKVKTSNRETIVRTSGVHEIQDSIFFYSCNILFGIDPRNVFSLEFINNTLSELDSFIFPRVIEKHFLDREYVTLEVIKGKTLSSFDALSGAELKKFGRNLAKIHKKKMDYLGNPLGNFQISLSEINQHIIRSMKKIIAAHYSSDQKIINYLPQIESLISGLQPPAYASYVLVDIDPTQFLVDDGVIMGLVDTEAYVIAPREIKGKNQ